MTEELFQVELDVLWDESTGIWTSLCADLLNERYALGYSTNDLLPEWAMESASEELKANKANNEGVNQ